jgi:TolB-like protein
MKRIVWFFIVFLSCVGTGFSQQPGANESVIHVSRTNTGGVINLDLNILVDGAKRAQIDKEFVRFVIPNGQHTIQATSGLRKSRAVNFTAQSQEIAFVVSSSGLSVELKKTGEKSVAGSADTPQAPAPEAPAQTATARSNTSAASGDVEAALNKAAGTIIDALPDKSTVAVLSISSRERNLSEFLIEELTYMLVESGLFKVVDRKSLDAIRSEQNFQLSGDVDDNSAVDIGKMLGANIVITGSVGGADSLRRLRLKALDVKTSEILTMASERF